MATATGVADEIQTLIDTDNPDDPLVDFFGEMRTWIDDLRSIPPVASLPSVEVFIQGLDHIAGNFGYTDRRAFLSENSGHQEGFKVVITTPPITAIAAGAVVGALELEIWNLADQNDAFDVQVEFRVFSMTNPVTDIIDVTTTWFVPVHTPQPGVMDFSGAVPTATLGVDLSWDGSYVHSAAGGVFIATLVAIGSWD